MDYIKQLKEYIKTPLYNTLGGPCHPSMVVESQRIRSFKSLGPGQPSPEEMAAGGYFESTKRFCECFSCGYSIRIKHLTTVPAHGPNATCFYEGLRLAHKEIDKTPDQEIQIRCKVCFSKESTILLFPCSHIGLCYVCCCAISKCPFCYQEIISIKQIYSPYSILYFSLL